MEKNELLKKFKTTLDFGTKPKNKQIVHPQRDWVIGLTVGLTIIIISGVWSVHIYFSHRNTQDVDVESVQVVVLYRESLVQQAIAEYEQRESRLRELLPDEPVVMTSTVSVEEVSTSTASTEEQFYLENEEDAEGDNEFIPEQEPLLNTVPTMPREEENFE
jgi:hypothetical protein